MDIGIDPSRILQTGFGFWGSKVLLTAVELGVFTALGDKGMTGEQLGKELGLHPRGIWDFFDCLVAMGFLQRDGSGPQALYRNTLEIETWTDGEVEAGGGFASADARHRRFALE